MTKKQLNMNGVISVPVFKDEKGNEYICLSVPNELQDGKGCWIYQQIKRKDNVMTFVGTLLEIYDEDMINIQLDIGSTALFEGNVEIVL